MKRYIYGCLIIVFCAITAFGVCYGIQKAVLKGELTKAEKVEYKMEDTSQEKIKEKEDSLEKESDEISEYIFPDSDSRQLTAKDLSQKSKQDLFVARNEIFARHGRKFDNESLQEYFNQMEWYNGTLNSTEFNESVLNKIEKKNLQLIKDAEGN